MVTHTVQVDDHQVVVVGVPESAAPDDARLRLSLGRLLAPVDIPSRLLEIQEARGPGYPTLWSFQVRQGSPPPLTALAARRPCRAGPIRVLLVEDSSLVCDMFRLGFRSRASMVHLEVLTDGEQAWRRWREGSFDLLIADHFLPGLGGAALVERVRHEQQWAEVPIISISMGGGAARTASLVAGADMFLDKPLVLRDLVGTIGFLAGQP